MGIFEKKHPPSKEDLESMEYKTYTLKKLLSKFYASRFNRDPYVPADKDEDINDSRRYRLYNKTDIFEIFDQFLKFFEELISTENIEDISFGKNLKLYRDVELPKLKNVTSMDRKFNSSIPEGDAFYVSRGRYVYKMKYLNEVKEGIDNMWNDDPRKKRRIEELIPRCEELNRKAKDGNENI